MGSPTGSPRNRLRPFSPTVHGGEQRFELLGRGARDPGRRVPFKERSRNADYLDWVMELERPAQLRTPAAEETGASGAGPLRPAFPVNDVAELVADVVEQTGLLSPADV